MSDRVTEAAYWEEIKALAAEAVQACRDGEIASREELCDWVHETIDAHQWVIYTGFNWDVLSVSPNDAAYAENFGTDGLISNGTLNTAALAFSAMEADLWNALGRVDGFDPHGDDGWGAAA